MRTLTKIAAASAVAVAMIGCTDQITGPNVPQDAVFHHGDAPAPLFRFASAWGVRTHVDGQSVLGIAPDPVVVSGISRCGSDGGANELAELDASPVLTTGTIETEARPLTFDDGIGVRTESEVQNVNALSGLITADAIRAVSTVSHHGEAPLSGTGEFRTSAEGTQFVGLRVAGVLITDTSPNTRIDIPGIGHVIINEQRRVTPANRHHAILEVIGLRIHVTTGNLLGIPVGTEIIVARALSLLRPDVAPPPLWGGAFATHANVGGLVVHGPTIPVNLPCAGTELRVRNLAFVNLPGLINSGTLETTAVGVVDPDTTWGRTTSTVEDVNILDGLIRAEVIRAQANVRGNADGVRVGHAGSHFVSLIVDGQQISDVEPNTRMEIEGVGTLFLHRVRRPDANKIVVEMIVLVVRANNELGLEPTVIRVAVARAGTQ